MAAPAASLVEQQRERLRQREFPVDKARFGDPLALRVDWFPASGGGASFLTHRLVERGPQRLEYRPTGTMLGFAIGILVIGLGCAGAFAAALLQLNRWVGMLTGIDAAVLVGLLFAALGVFMLWHAWTPRVFDRGRGWYWSGHRAPGRGDRADAGRCPLADIHAVQLIQERCSGTDAGGGYWSYELNLVRRDGTRVHVVDHGARDHLVGDGEVLAAWLGCKLWDATGP